MPQPDVLPEMEEFDFKNDTHDYVVVPPSQVKAYTLNGYTSVARNITNHDGTMYVMERPRE